MLKDSKVTGKIILSVVPLTAVCGTALSSVIAAIILLITVASTWALLPLIKQFLSEKTAPFVRIIIALGVIGTLTMVSTVFFKEATNSIAVYLPLIAITVIMLSAINENIESTPIQALKLGATLGGLGSVFLFAVGVLKEFLGMGSLFGFNVYTKLFAPIEFFKNPAGSLLICAGLAIIYNLAVKYLEKRAAK